MNRRTNPTPTTDLSRQLRAAKFIVSVNGVSDAERIMEFDSAAIADELDRLAARIAALEAEVARPSEPAIDSPTHKSA